MCGDWNIDTLNGSRFQEDLADLLQTFNLINTILHPTRETKSTSSLIDVMIINRTQYKIPSTIYELGLSDHHAQILSVRNSEINNNTTKIWSRHFNKHNILKFSDSLRDLTWKEVFLKTKVNAQFEAVMNQFSVLFDSAFPLKLTNSRKPLKATWITQGIRTSSKNFRLINKTKNHLPLSEDNKIIL